MYIFTGILIYLKDSTIEQTKLFNGAFFHFQTLRKLFEDKQMLLMNTFQVDILSKMTEQLSLIVTNFFQITVS